MDLNTYERLLLLSTLPEKGTFTNLRVVREMRESLSFSEAEHKALKFREGEDGLVHWQPEGDKPKAFEFGEVALKVIKDAIFAIQAKEEGTADLLDLWDKFGFEQE